MEKQNYHKNKFRGFRLKDARQKRGLNQKQLEDKIGVGIRSVGKFELERLYPSAETEKKLCEFFKVDSNYFRRDSD